MSTPEFKQHSLHHLEPHFQQSVLQKVLDEEMSLSEMKRGAADFHSLGIVYQPFYDSPAGLRQRSNFLHLAYFTAELQTKWSRGLLYMLPSCSWQHSFMKPSRVSHGMSVNSLTAQEGDASFLGAQLMSFFASLQFYVCYL